jgi:hypothetical protein
MNISILLILEILAVLAIIGWMVKKRAASGGEHHERDEKKPDRKLENVLDLPNEERWE